MPFETLFSNKVGLCEMQMIFMNLQYVTIYSYISFFAKTIILMISAFFLSKWRSCSDERLTGRIFNMFYLLIQNTILQNMSWLYSKTAVNVAMLNMTRVGTGRFTALCHHLCGSPQSRKQNNFKKEAWRGFRSEFLQEAEHQVSQCGTQRFVVVADDVCPILLQLNQCVLCLQVQNVSVCCLLHFDLCNTMLWGGGGKTIAEFNMCQAKSEVGMFICTKKKK